MNNSVNSDEVGRGVSRSLDSIDGVIVWHSEEGRKKMDQWLKTALIPNRKGQ